MVCWIMNRPDLLLEDMRLYAIGGFFLPLIYQSSTRLTGVVVILLGFAGNFQLLVVC